MSNPEEHYRDKQPPYIDPSLVIDTRLREVERQQAEDKKYQREYNTRQLRFNKWLVIFTGLLFATSVVSDIFLFRYVELTKNSADAAKSAADTAREALTSGQRAFIAFSGIDTSIPPLDILPAPQMPKVIGFKATFEKSGITAARSVRIFGSYAELKAGISRFQIPDIPSTWPAINVVFGPKEKHSTAPIEIPFAALRDPNHVYVFWGWVIYRDAFERTPGT